MTTRTQAPCRRSTTRRKRTASAPRSNFGPIFFIVMGVTIAGALGFVGVVASVLAGS